MGGWNQAKSVLRHKTQTTKYQREREIDRQTETETERQRQRQRDRDKQTETNRQRQKLRMCRSGGVGRLRKGGRGVWGVGWGAGGDQAESVTVVCFCLLNTPHSDAIKNM